MKKMLKGRKFITVAELRKDRSLLPRITGDISGLYGEISNDLYGDISGLYGEISNDLYGEISRGLIGNISGLTGNISRGLTGNVSGLYGEISNDLYGEISGDLYGEISGLTGNVTGLHGDIDECEITDGERTAGVRIESLIGQ